MSDYWKRGLCARFALGFLLVVGASFGAAELPVYSTPHYVAGGEESLMLLTGRPAVSVTRALAFAGATLEEIEQATFGGYMFGINQPGDALSYFTHPYRDASGTLQFLTVCVQKRDYKNDSDCHIKSVAIKLTQGDEGVYAQMVRSDGKSPYYTTTDTSQVATRDFVSVASNGTISFKDNSGVLGYSLRSLFALKFVPSSDRALVFANPSGGSTLTVDDIKDYSFEGVFVGLSVNYRYLSQSIPNKLVILDSDGKATKIRLELQIVDDRYLKCVIIDLTNGTGGVWAQAVRAGYRELATEGVVFGAPFLTEAGTWAFSDIKTGTLVTSILESGYGAAGLVARRDKKPELLLDESKTWTELTNGVDSVRTAPEVKVRVVGTNPTLTFDVPVEASALTFLANNDSGASFIMGEDIDGGLALDSLAVDLGGSTFRKTGSETLALATQQGVTVSGTGTFNIHQGLLSWTRPAGSNSSSTFTGSTATFSIDDDGLFETEGSVFFQQVINNGCIRLQTNDRDLTFAGTYTGTGQVDKYGEGYSAFMTLSSLSSSTITVHAGRFALYAQGANNANYHFVTPQSPNANVKIVVRPGAQYDVNGKRDFNATVQIAGSFGGGKSYSNGAFSNRGAAVGNGAAQTVQLILADDAQVGGLADFGLLAPGFGPSQLELNGHTMDLYTEGAFWLANTTVVGPGTLSVRGGTLTIHHDATTGSDWTLETLPEGQVAFNQALSCSNLVWRGVASGTGVVTAYGTYAPHGGTLPQVLLSGSGAGLDLSEQTATWNLDTGKVSFAPETKIRIEVGTRVLQDNQKLISWAAIPDHVSAWNFDKSLRRFRLEARSDGLYVRANQCILYVY